MAPVKAWLLGALLLAPLWAGASEPYGQHDIPLLANRFRIDHGVKVISFIIQRTPGTPSVVLVRPDGSKFYSRRHPQDKVSWLVTPDADLVTVRDPMPGPWQAVGEIALDNRVRLLTDIQLQFDPVPLRLYRDEIIKLTSRILIDGSPATEQEYLSSLGMTVRLQRFSDETPQGAPVQDLVIGRYLDDGKGFDERPHDGVLTAETVLDAPTGKYRAVITTGNEVFVRARHQEVLLYPLPFHYDLTLPTAEVGPTLTLLLDRDEIDPASVALAGEVTDPAGEAVSFKAIATDQRLVVPLPLPKTIGKYDIGGQIYATTRDGREIRLRLPPKSFNIYPPPPPPQTVSASVPTEPIPEEDNGWLIWALLGVAVLLGLGGGLGFLVMQKRRVLKRVMAAQQAAEPVPDKVPPGELDLNLPEQ